MFVALFLGLALGYLTTVKCVARGGEILGYLTGMICPQARNLTANFRKNVKSPPHTLPRHARQLCIDRFTKVALGIGHLGKQNSLQ